MVSSNFERLLFDLHGRNGALVKDLMDSFRQNGKLSVEPERWTEARRLFDSLAVDDEATCATIAEVHAQCGEVLDPHTAIGGGAHGEAHRRMSNPMITQGTAHPGKIPGAGRKAGVVEPQLPPPMADLFDHEASCTVMPNSLTEIQQFVSAHG